MAHCKQLYPDHANDIIQVWRRADESSHICSQGVGYGKASRAGLGSLTKMSPLQVTDQMACLEGGPWIPLESQQDTLSNASWTGREGERKRGMDERWRWREEERSGRMYIMLVSCNTLSFVFFRLCNLTTRLLTGVI